MALNVTTAVFAEGCNAATASPSLVQWDRGQKLVLDGLTLPASYQVEFSGGGTVRTVPMIGDQTGVEIPNVLLQSSHPITAYIVLHEGENDRESEYWVTIYVKPRQAPVTTDPDPEQADIIDQTIAAANAAKDAAEGFAADAEAASQAIQDMTVSATTLSPGSPATVQKTVDPETGAVNLAFGVPRGADGGGSGGTSDYHDLSNKPSIEGTTLDGNLSASDLGLAKTTDIPSVPVQSVAGKTGDVTLDGGDVGFNAQGSYSSGTVGAELSDLKTEISAKPDIDLGITGATAGTYAKVKTVDGSGKPTSWEYGAGGGGGGTSDYTDLTNKPQIEGVTLSGNKSASDLGLAKASDIPAVPVQSVNGKTGAVVLSASDVGAGTYSKPSSGIPKTDLASAVRTSLGKADSAYQLPSGGIPSTDLASAVQTSLGKADTALQSVPSTYRTSAAQDTIDAGKIDKPSSPATGAFLVYNGSAWVAQTLSTWQGGSF